MFRTPNLLPFVFSIVLLGIPALAHDGPDPVAHWILNGRHIDGNTLKARLGPNGEITGTQKIVTDKYGASLLLSGPDAGIECGDVNAPSVKSILPSEAMTVSAWVSVDKRRQWGSLISVLQDNGNAESGWILGYNQRQFYFGLSTDGADDGDGKMTYLVGETEYETGKLYHVVAVYDGNEMQLFVNGRLDASSREQSGKIRYPQKAPFTLGVYRDDDENFPHTGRLRDIAVYDMAAKPAWVIKEFEHQKRLADLPPQSETPETLEFVVKPYLQFATQREITVAWQASKPIRGIVLYGETAETKRQATADEARMINQIRLTDLKPHTQYFYRTVSTDSEGKTLTSELRTFQTACDETTPFAFAIISDTQSNPKVANKIAKMAWEQRPSFLIHPGDLVGTGTADTHWTEQFFPSMDPLISRVPFYPVLGNHEVNAKNYYDYMALPSPEYYYQFSYGNADFFMIDTNKKVDPESEQFKWLEKALAASKARWKFVVHHHPPFSSDENDYGNLWKTNQSTRGDLRARQLCRLYDKYGVDVVWNGHIHSYERTWPIFDQKVVPGRGTVYMITGGGGGSLETPGPFRPFFQNNVKRGHHYCMAYINGGVLEFKAFDLEGRLFDYNKIEKKKK